MIDTRVHRKKKNEQKNVVYNDVSSLTVILLTFFYTKTEIETLFFVGGVIKAIP